MTGDGKLAEAHKALTAWLTENRDDTDYPIILEMRNEIGSQLAHRIYDSVASQETKA